MPYAAGTAFVAIRPSLRGFHTALRTELAQQNPVVEVKVRFKVERLNVPRVPDQTVRIRAEVDKASLSGAIIHIARLGSALAALALPGAVIAAAPQLISLAGAAAQASGALLLIPAAGLAAGAAIGTLAVGFRNMGDALGPTGTPAQLKKVNEALATMAPAARAVVGEIRSLSPAWDALRLDVQTKLFAGTATAIGALAGTYLPVLRSGLTGVASELNLSAQGFAAWAQSAGVASTISGIFEAVRSTFHDLVPVGANIASIFTNIASVGAQFLPGLATGFADVVQKVKDFVASAEGLAQIKDWIQGGIDTISSLFSIVGSGGGVLTGLFDAAKSAGIDFMGTMVDATALTDTFLNSGVGQTALTSIFQSINDTVAALLPGLVAVGAAVGTGLVALGPALPSVAKAMSDVAVALSPLISDLALLTSVILPPLAQLLSSISPLLGPIAAGLLAMLVVGKMTALYAGATAAIGAFAVATGAMTAASVASAGPLALLRGGILAVGFALVANPIGIFITALIAIGAVLVFAYNHFEGFRAVVDTVFAAIGTAAMWLWENAIKPALDFIVVGFGAVGSAVQFAWENVIKPVIGFFVAYYQTLGAIAIWLWENAIKPAWDGIVAGIGAAWAFLGPIFGFIGAAVEFMGKLIFAIVVGLIIVAWEFLSTAIKSVWESVLRPVWDAVAVAAMWLWTNALKPAFDFIGAAWQVLLAGIEAVWDTVLKPTWDAIAAAAMWLWDNALRPAFDFISTAWAAMAQANERIYQSVIRPVLDTFGAAGTFLWESVLRPAFDFISTAWAGMGRANEQIYRDVIAPIFGFFEDAVTTFSDVFTRVVDGIKSVWSSIQEAFKAPIRFVVNTVWNDGIGGLWDKAAALFPLGPFPRVALPFAKGGPIERPTLALMGEAGPEYVLSAPAVRGLGGMDAVDRMHRDAVARPVSLRALNSGGVVEGADHDGPGVSRSGFGGVKPHVAAAGHFLRQMFGIGSVGGVGQRANASDHPRGLALDFMTYSDLAKGDRLASYMQANAAHFAVKYLIWRQRINSGSGWRQMADRGSVTANHFDHVHASFLDGPGGGAAFSGDGGGFFNPLPEIIRGFFDLLVNPLVNSIPGGPPMILDIPKAIAVTARDKSLRFLLEKAGETFDSGGIARGAGMFSKNTIKPERVLDPQQTVAFERLVGFLDRAPSQTSAPGRARYEPLAGGSGIEDRLDQVIAALQAGGAGASITVEDRSGNPVETAQRTVLALRTR